MEVCLACIVVVDVLARVVAAPHLLDGGGVAVVVGHAGVVQAREHLIAQ